MFDLCREDETGMDGVKIRKVSENNPEELC